MGKHEGHEKHEGHDKHEKKGWKEVVTGIEKKKDAPLVASPGVAPVDNSQSTFSKVFNVVVRIATIAVFAYVIWFYLIPLV
jgi:hypothetical protein